MLSQRFRSKFPVPRDAFTTLVIRHQFSDVKSRSTAARMRGLKRFFRAAK